MELFAKTANYWKLLTVFAKKFILDVWQGSRYASAQQQANTCFQVLSKNKIISKYTLDQSAEYHATIVKS